MNYIPLLKNTSLCADMTDEEISAALGALGYEVRSYKKDAVILSRGDVSPMIGVILEGSANVETVDVLGQKTILARLDTNHTFGEAFSLLHNPMGHDIAANKDSTIMFLNIQNLYQFRGKKVTWATKMATNLLVITSRKISMLSAKCFHITPKTIRDRVMSYLSSVAMQEGSDEFDIPYDRQQLAFYLNLERSALSKELGKMQREGLIYTRKNHFKILKPDIDI